MAVIIEPGRAAPSRRKGAVLIPDAPLEHLHYDRSAQAWRSHAEVALAGRWHGDLRPGRPEAACA